MVELITQLVKYLSIVLIGVYTYEGFAIFRYEDKIKKNRILNRMYALMITIHVMLSAVLYVNTKDINFIFLYAGELLVFIVFQSIYHWIYPQINEIVMQHMMMLLMLGFVFLGRLSFDKALRQVLISAVSLLLCLVVPIIIDKFYSVRRLGYILSVAGIGLLAVVKVIGVEKYGAKNWIQVAGIELQPSEFVKIIFVFAMAGLLYEVYEFKQIIIPSALAAIHVLVLVVERDLGGALLFFIVYVAMLTVATKNRWYMAIGLGAGSLAATIAYKAFSHVRVRVTAWQNPWAVIDSQGYQVTQSLFAIGTGGWFGFGLYHGLPTSIPVVQSDFIFSAISEEMGAIFALCIILICMSCFVMFINISMTMRDSFYKLVALGFSVLYAFQVFLNIGGVTKLIPSTGVTLPLISYGGSSLLSTIIIFSIIQGLYLVSSRVDRVQQKNMKKRK